MKHIPTFENFLNEAINPNILEDVIDNMDKWFATYKRTDWSRDAENQYYEALESDEGESEKIFVMSSVLSAHSDENELKKIVGNKVNIGSGSPFWKELAAKVIKDNPRP